MYILRETEGNWIWGRGTLKYIFLTSVVFYMNFKEKKGRDQGNCLSREYIRKGMKKEKLIDKLTKRKCSNYRVS